MFVYFKLGLAYKEPFTHNSTKRLRLKERKKESQGVREDFTLRLRLT